MTGEEKKILIIGGGFIGVNAAKQLIGRGNKVICFNRSVPLAKADGITWLQGDFYDEEQVGTVIDGMDIVIHALSSMNPGNSNVTYMQGYEKDMIHTLRLCGLVKEKNIKLVFISSGGSVYGNQETQPIKEDAPKYPINHYGNLKLELENAMLVFNRQMGTNIKIARLSNPYGIGQNYTRGVGFVDAVLRRGIRGECIEIYGDGSIVRDYISINDASKMLCTLVNYEGPEEVFNISTGIGSSQKDIVDLASTWIPDLKVTYKPARDIDVSKNILDNSRIKKICGISPVKLAEGMYRYYQYLKSTV